MNSIKIIFVLALVVIASARSRFGQPKATDEDLFREFIECARYAIITGIPEIGVPSHDPLIIQEEINYEFPPGEALTGSISMNNMVVTDIPNWEVRQFDEIRSNDQGVDVFNYTIYWPKMVFTGDFEYSLTFLGWHLENKGTMTLELDHVNFAGIFDFTTPGSDRTETINDLLLHVSSQEVKLDLTNLGVLGDFLDEIGGPIVSDLLNNVDDSTISEAIKNKLTVDWINKPERIDALISNCQK